MRSDADGRYQFSTIRPASYPGRNVPQHIHLTILEPNGRYYYIAEIEFEDDPLLPKSRLMAKNPRGGLGVIPLSEENGVYYGKRDIILGLNIPNYE
ncbi:hypothetical protein C7460_11742 [Marinoscillum furvescens DSM 4134]|uniref:Intradiol ring-cleavage dioxygenases domain-containing protein n=1 Tax=Marinoscillum furvescens DSM 4134 TaxID=1122208 RepID=A0A3D9L0B3_MARFU|nr:hypothetical protein C7460_11742 [Marinoscillum furvescens DSM 4134]